MTMTQRTGWQPIETAPAIDRSGFLIAAFSDTDEYGRPAPDYVEWVGRRTSDGRWHNFNSGNYSRFNPEPTHWMPLPQPPEASP